VFGHICILVSILVNLFLFFALVASELELFLKIVKFLLKLFVLFPKLPYRIVVVFFLQGEDGRLKGNEQVPNIGNILAINFD